MQDKYIQTLLKEAEKAYKMGEIPVGAIIVYDDEVIAKAHNNRQSKYCLLGHAEINAIIKAEKKLKDWRLDKCIMYVTLAPCKMCEIMINESRISKVYYLIKNVENTCDNFNELSGYLREKREYEEMLKKFFKNLRK